TGRIVQRLEQIFGKRGHCAREIMPVLRQRVSGEFPMARGRVLALRLLGRTRVEALRRAGYFQPWWNAMCGKAARLAQTQSREISQGQSAAMYSCFIGVSGGAGFSNMPNGIGAVVAITR